MRGAANRIEQQDFDIERSHSGGEPVTSYESKMVMLRAERNDQIKVEDVISRVVPNKDIPTEARVRKRTNPYFGPKIILQSDGSKYLLTALGPDTELLLWYPNYLEDGEQHGWNKLAEVSVSFTEGQPQYDLCPQCGEPMQTLEHERKAAVGKCLGPDD